MSGSSRPMVDRLPWRMRCSAKWLKSWERHLSHVLVLTLWALICQTPVLQMISSASLHVKRWVSTGTRWVWALICQTPVLQMISSASLHVKRWVSTGTRWVCNLLLLWHYWHSELCQFGQLYLNYQYLFMNWGVFSAMLLHQIIIWSSICLMNQLLHHCYISWSYLHESSQHMLISCSTVFNLFMCRISSCCCCLRLFVTILLLFYSVQWPATMQWLVL